MTAKGDHPRTRATDGGPASIGFHQAENELVNIFLEEEDKRPRQYAIIATCFIFTILFLVTLPEGERQAIEPMVVYVPDLSTYIPPVKQPPKEQVERQVVEKVRKIALPDPTPEEPEPIREALPEPPPEPIPANAIVLRGLPPRGPPVKVAAQSPPVTEGTAGLTNPKVLEAPKPVYPSLAQRAGAQGVVVIRVLIDRNGTVASAELVEGIGKFGMDEAAMDAVKKRKYSPGLLEGRPVEVISIVRVTFKLAN